MLLIGGLGAIAAQTRRQFTTFPQRKQKHQHKVANYRQDKQERERQKRLHYEQEQTKFRRKLVLKALSKTIPHDGNQSNGKEGRSEAGFYPYLKRYFPNKIYRKLTLDNPKFHIPYSPDFAYIDTNINLYIDIEIDEPYIYQSKEPIHYFDYWNDENRNHFFGERGWLVIRFSEEQIVKYPKSCCKTVAETIAETIADLLSDNSLLNQFRNVPSLQKMKQWTKNEAEEMASKDYRKTYLSR